MNYPLRLANANVGLIALSVLLLLALRAPGQVARKNNADSLLYFNKLLGPKEMQEDLQLFRAIREQANSGLYQYRTRAQIDSIYRWASARVKQPRRTTEFHRIILQLTDFEGSVHNYTELDAGLKSFLKRQKAFFPYPLAYLDGHIVLDFDSKEIPAGARILSINGVKEAALRQSFYKYFPADGYTVTEKLSASVEESLGLNYLIEYGLTDKFQIEYSPLQSTAQKKATLPAVSLTQQQENYKKRYSAPVANTINFKVQPPYSFRAISPATALLSLRWFGMVTGEEDPGFKSYVRFIDSVFAEINKRKISNLIIDVRSNPGGSDPTFEQPVMHLASRAFKENTKAYINFDPVIFPYEKYFWGITTAARMDSVSREMGKRFLKDRFPKLVNGLNEQNPKYNPAYSPKLPTFSGNLYLLIDQHVASAASHFASLVKSYAKEPTVVGVETVGGYYAHNGHTPLVYELPNSKIKTKFSIVHVQQDAVVTPDQPVGRGVIPTHTVWPTMADFLGHKDSQLEFVLKLIGERAAK